MKKIFSLSILLLSIAFNLSAQRTGTIKGTLIDETTREPIPGAVIEVALASDTTQKQYFTSVYQGGINIPGLAYGDYRLKFSFIGYHELVQNVKIDRGTITLNEVVMSQQAQAIGTVVLEGQAMRTSQRGDTVVYNAASFKVAADADTEALLSKMPGLKVIDGTVEAQGESVKKVFVDGKEYFGEDVTSTIKTIPAEMISQVQVYDKLSDNAEFSGVDDGEGYKAINIVTKVSQGGSAQFGKLYAGYGFNDMYIVGGNVNIYNGKSRIGIIGLANNMNQQNFSNDDILGAMGESGGMSSRGGGYMRGGGTFRTWQMDGISTSQLFGINYSGQWGPKIDAQASYFFNNSKNENERISDKLFTDRAQMRYDTTTTERYNTEHRIEGRLEYKPNANHSIMMRPSFRFQDYDNLSNASGKLFDTSSSIEDLINDYISGSDNKRWGYNISNSIIYRVRLGKPGRTLTTDIGGTISNNDSRTFTNNSLFYTGLPEDLTKRKTVSDSKSYRVNGRIMYSEPISSYSQVNAQYRLSYNYSDEDQKVYDWLAMQGIYDTDPISDRSSVYNSGYLTQQVGPGFNWSKNRNAITVNASYQYSSLTKDQELPAPAFDSKYNFNDFVYFAMANIMLNPANSIRFHVRSNTNNPSVSQLRNVISDNNKQSISTGNPDLDPSYSNNFMLNYNRSNVTKGTTFNLSGHYTTTSDYIGEDRWVNTGSGPLTLSNGVVLEKGAQFTMPINLSGYWMVRGNTSFGFPMKLIRSNVNINAGMTYSESPSMLNGTKNTRRGQYYNAGIVIGSNISERIDFTLNYNGGYNIASYTQTTENENEFFNHYASATFKFVGPIGLTFSGNIAWSLYKGITDDYSEDYVACNLYIGKKIFKNQRGEINFGVNDLFNQSESFRRTVTDSAIENVRNNVLGRYFGVQLIYNLRNIGKAPQRSSRGGDSLRGPGGPPAGHMGPPPGGGFR